MSWLVFIFHSRRVQRVNLNRPPHPEGPPSLQLLVGQTVQAETFSFMVPNTSCTNIPSWPRAATREGVDEEAGTP